MKGRRRGGQTGGRGGASAASAPISFNRRSVRERFSPWFQTRRAALYSEFQEHEDVLR